MSAVEKGSKTVIAGLDLCTYPCTAVRETDRDRMIREAVSRVQRMEIPEGHDHVTTWTMTGDALIFAIKDMCDGIEVVDTKIMRSFDSFSS